MHQDNASSTESLELRPDIGGNVALELICHSECHKKGTEAWISMADLISAARGELGLQRIITDGTDIYTVISPGLFRYLPTSCCRLWLDD
jgi:hypothetical protein